MKSVAALLIVLMFWVVGLLAFTARIERSTPAPAPPEAEAVVALTGNANIRITSAVKLLEEGKARRMLVSGVNPDVTRAELRSVSKATQNLYDCCVQLGFDAADTKGNAAETAAWVNQQGFKSLIVVTADYHMPRALLEMKGALPGVAVIPYPVATPEVQAKGWWKREIDARRILVEYMKYLAVFAREAFLSLGPKEEPKAKPAAAK
jgi:uncharacterized SAM-binding protein YcdF (DUF218 family)